MSSLNSLWYIAGIGYICCDKRVQHYNKITQQNIIALSIEQEQTLVLHAIPDYQETYIHTFWFHHSLGPLL